MKGGIFALRRLRWKLTLSYTLVTVVALLAVELVVAAALLAFLSSPILPGATQEQLENIVAPSIEDELSQSPPDTAGVDAELRRLQTSRQDGGITLTLPDDGSVFVVDESGRTVGSLSREVTAGERFDASEYPGLAPMLDSALAGEQDSSRLRRYSDDFGLMLAAAPVESDGKVVGAAVAVFRIPAIGPALLTALGVSSGILVLAAASLGTIFGFITALGLTRRLRRLAVAARSWSRGDFSVVVRDRSKDELGQLSRELNSMAAELENLLQTREELATLEARNRFARDLHDSVKQQVFATSLQIAAARAMMDRDKEAAEDHLAQAEEIVHGAQRELNVLIHEMRPAALEGKGLVTALEDYAADWSRRSEILATVRASGEREIPLEAEQAVFRVAQEALANVARHSGARKAEVVLNYGAGRLILTVADDGQGFGPLHKPGDGYGLQSMHERLLKLGGYVEVESAPGRGTTITAVLPLGGTRR